MTLTTVGFDKDPKSLSEIGSMLFRRGVSGTRVVTGKEVKVIEGFTFRGDQSMTRASIGLIQKIIFITEESFF